MKCLVLSDSHGRVDYIERVLRMHPDAEVVFFLGDGLSDADARASSDKSKMWLAVRGNCDFRGMFKESMANKTDEIILMGKKIVLTHGDLYGVKASDSGLYALRESRGADIILYGHTHIPRSEYVSGDNPFYLFNPGSLGEYPHSFGILTLSENAVLFSHGRFS